MSMGPEVATYRTRGAAHMLGATLALLCALVAGGCDDEDEEASVCPPERRAPSNYDRSCTQDAECELVAYQSCPCGSCGSFAVRVEEVDAFRADHPRCQCGSRVACGACEELVAGCEAGTCRMYVCASDGCVERTLLPDEQ
jgi:hypothetical protein